MDVDGADPLDGDPRLERFFGSSWPNILGFHDLLVREGELRGLVGPREFPRLWERHILNSAAVVPFLPTTGRIIDLGSGAGLPGVVVAAMLPDVEVVLLEPMERRTDWLSEVAETLRLENVVVRRGRAQDEHGQADRGRGDRPGGRLARQALPMGAAPSACGRLTGGPQGWPGGGRDRGGQACGPQARCWSGLRGRGSDDRGSRSDEGGPRRTGGCSWCSVGRSGVTTTPRSRRTRPANWTRTDSPRDAAVPSEAAGRAVVPSEAAGRAVAPSEAAGRAVVPGASVAAAPVVPSPGAPGTNDSAPWGGEPAPGSRGGTPGAEGPRVFEPRVAVPAPAGSAALRGVTRRVRTAVGMTARWPPHPRAAW